MHTARELSSPEELRELLAGVRRVAVLGVRSEAFADRPAHYVAAALAGFGVEVIPVPVYEPEVTTILGRPVVRSLRAVPKPIDLVDVFRRARDLPAHLDDLVALRPRAVWLQTGLRSDAFVQAMVAAGISVVQDRCLMVEWRAHGPVRGR
ncbi:MAG: CoA-binding protein [Deltaproteobacteria bacterium]|nr:CoA-binding protein [Deltaproteobacteria bacterium]